jgi:hypothetical protein
MCPALSSADKKVLGLLDEENIKELTESHAEIIRVIFSDTFSYHLKFQFDQRIPTSRELRDHNGSSPDTQPHTTLYFSGVDPFIRIDVIMTN